MSDMLHSMLITFVRCKLRSNKCDEEKKKKILEHVENVASRRIVGAWIDKTYAKVCFPNIHIFLTTQYADNEEKNSISYAAYCKAFEVDEDSFDWNDVAVELMEQLEEEISAIWVGFVPAVWYSIPVISNFSNSLLSFCRPKL